MDLADLAVNGAAVRPEHHRERQGAGGVAQRTAELGAGEAGHAHGKAQRQALQELAHLLAPHNMQTVGTEVAEQRWLQQGSEGQ